MKFLFSVLSIFAFCAIAQGDNALRTAYCDGAMAHVQGLVVDERGLPVSNATVRVEFSSLGDVARSNVTSVHTDEIGRFEASGRAKYGTGVHDDMLLRFSARTISHVRGSYQMEVCFTNNPCAGMHLGEGDALSDLKIPHVADPSGVYVGYHRFERNFTGENKTDTYLKKGMYAVVRTRTKIDADGKLVSACYGVISGMWISGGKTMRMEDASFNSACNDLAIEDGYYLRKRLEEYNCRNRE